MRFHIYTKAPKPFGPNATGGSEQYHIELGRRLAAKGHEVTSYTNCDQPTPFQHDGVTWRDLSAVDLSAPGIWIMQRDPAICFDIPQPHPDRVFIFAAHDLDHECIQDGVWWAERFDMVFAESEIHAQYLRSKYKNANVAVTGAGFPMERVDEALAGSIRNPKRIIHTSDPSRGLLNLLLIFQRAREEEPELELAVTYGWDHIDLMISKGQSMFRKHKAKLQKLMEQPGVTWLGRLPTPFDVWREMAKSGIYCYPSSYAETFCNSVAEAQVFGAIPVVSAGWALGENTRYGVITCGDPDDDRLIRARFVRALVNLARRQDTQEQIRTPMMEEARKLFNFQDSVDRIENLCLQALGTSSLEVVGVGV